MNRPHHQTAVYDSTGTRWMAAAACKDMDHNLFFTESETPNRVAIDTCRLCPVRITCSDHAIEHDLAGTWGGTSHRERRKIRNQRDANRARFPGRLHSRLYLGKGRHARGQDQRTTRLRHLTDQR